MTIYVVLRESPHQDPFGPAARVLAVYAALDAAQAFAAEQNRAATERAAGRYMPDLCRVEAHELRQQEVPA